MADPVQLFGVNGQPITGSTFLVNESQNADDKLTEITNDLLVQKNELRDQKEEIARHTKNLEKQETLVIFGFLFLIFTVSGLVLDFFYYRSNIERDRWRDTGSSQPQVIYLKQETNR